MTALAPVRAALAGLILSPCVVWAIAVGAAQERRLPDQLDDAAFWQPVTSAVSTVLDAHRRGDLKTQCDLVTASR